MPLSMINISPASEWFGLWITVVLIMGALAVIVHIACALGILLDGAALARQRRQPELIALAIWALAALLGGVFVLAVYWLIHHSTMNPEVGRSNRGHPSAAPRTAATVKEHTESPVKNQPSQEFDLDDLLSRNEPDPPEEK